MEVDRIDAAILAEELAEIYSSPTPKGWPEPKNVNDLFIGLIVSLYNSRGLIFIPGIRIRFLSKHDSSQFLTLKKTFLI